MQRGNPEKKRPYTYAYIYQQIKDLEAEKRGAIKALKLASGDALLRVRAHIVVLERNLRWYRGRISPKNTPELRERSESTRRARENRNRLVLDLAQNPRSLPMPAPQRASGNGPRAVVPYRWEEEDL